jgi:hypothetical protein
VHSSRQSMRVHHFHDRPGRCTKPPTPFHRTCSPLSMPFTAHGCMCGTGFRRACQLCVGTPASVLCSPVIPLQPGIHVCGTQRLRLPAPCPPGRITLLKACLSGAHSQVAACAACAFVCSGSVWDVDVLTMCTSLAAVCTVPFTRFPALCVQSEGGSGSDSQGRPTGPRNQGSGPERQTSGRRALVCVCV